MGNGSLVATRSAPEPDSEEVMRDHRWITRLAIAWAAAWLVLAVGGLASADMTSDLRRDPALILARALVSEAGYAPRADHVAILHVLAHRSERLRIRDPLRAHARLAVLYCSALRIDRTPLSRHAATTRAATWRYLEREAPEVVQLVRAWAAGERPEDPCGGRAVHWGSRFDARRWPASAVVDCGDTANVFLSTETP